MESEANLVAAVLAFRDGTITGEQFAAVCEDHARNPDRPMLDRLTDRGWLDTAQRDRLQDQLAKAITQHQGDARSTLVSIADSQSREILTASIEIVFPQEPRLATDAPVVVAETGVTDAPLDSDTTLPPRDDDEATLDFSIPPTRPDRSDTADMQASPRHDRVGPLGDGEGHTERYTRSRLHASGGVGQVWLARDTSLLREVALKELRADRRYTARTAQRFVTEARITGALQHPGIIPIYELDTDPDSGRPFYTMRFVSGQTLSKAVAEYHRDRAANPMALRDLLTAFEDVCQAVAFAHSKGIIHRDLKPGNVVLGDFGEALLLDWGLAKVIGTPEPEPETEPESDGPDEPPRPPIDPARDRTIQGTVKGTPAYMAPEQARGDVDQIGPLTDVYGLGAILYEILTGALPFTGSNTTVLLEHVRDGTPIPPRKVNPNVPPALEAVCLRAMARNPANRYPSAGDLAADIRQWLAGEPVSAYPEPFVIRAGRWARKHRTGLSVGLAALVVGTAALAVGNVLIRAQRDEAIRQKARALDLADFARQSAEQMYLKFSEYWLDDTLDPLQRQTLEQAAVAFARFSEQESDDAGVHRRQARALYQLGDVDFKLGRLPRADEDFHRALTMIGQGVDDAESRRERAYIHLRLAQLEARRGEPSRSAQELTSARDALGGDQASADLDPTSRALLGRIRYAEAESLRLADQPIDAESADRAAVALLDPVVNDPDPPFSARLAIVSSLDSLGLLLHESGRNAEALEPLTRARNLGAALLTDFPTSAAAREALARAWNTDGLTQAALKDTPRARAALLASRDLYQRLSDDHPTRPEYKRGLARSLFNLGNLLFRDGAPGAEAASLYRQGIAIHRKLDQPPDDFKYRRDLGRALLNLGSFDLADGTYDNAAVCLRQAQDLFRTLASEFPEVPDMAGSLALAMGKTGDLARARGDLPAAVDAYGQAITEYEALIARHAGVARFRREQAQFLNNLGLAQIDARQPDRARDAFTRALDIYAREYAQTRQAGYLPLMASTRVNRATLRGDDAADDYNEAVSTYRTLAAAQDSPAIREALAIALYNQGRFRSIENRPDPEGPLDEAITRLTAIVESRPESALAQSTLGNALERRARIVQDAEPDRALAILQSALYHQQQAVAQSPRDRLYRNSLLDHYEAMAQLQHRRGDLGTAAAMAETLAQVDPSSAAAKVRAARLLAALRTGPHDDSPQAAERAARAVSMLSAAVAKGGIDRSSLAHDPDFAAIAGRDDFQALINPPKPADQP